MSAEINADLLAYLADLSKVVSTLPHSEQVYGDYYVREVVVFYGDGPIQEHVGSFKPNDFGSHDYWPASPMVA